MPLVSVVIPLYNKEPHIKRAIDSVLAQKIQDFEIIVIDDGSTDKSAEVVKNFTDPRIRLIQQENAGVSAARNRGIKEAKADLIAFLDADDEWTTSFLETILRLREKYPEAGAYATAYKDIGINSETNGNYKGIPPKFCEGLIPNYFYTARCGTPPISSSSVAIGKKIFYDLGMFPLGERWAEDTDMWGKIALKYRIAFSLELGAMYHKEACNRACNRKIPVEEHPFVKTVKQRMESLKMEKNGDYIYELNEYVAKEQIKTAALNLKIGSPNIARKILSNCETKEYKKEKTMTTFWTYIPSIVFTSLLYIKHNYIIRYKNKK